MSEQLMICNKGESCGVRCDDKDEHAIDEHCSNPCAFGGYCIPVEPPVNKIDLADIGEYAPHIPPFTDEANTTVVAECAAPFAVRPDGTIDTDAVRNYATRWKDNGLGSPMILAMCDEIERLRNACDAAIQRGNEPNASLTQALDVAENLHAENERLRKECDELRGALELANMITFGPEFFDEVME